MWAFLIELDGDDLRRDLLAVRKAMLGSSQSLLPPMRLLFEGIVSKHKDSRHHSGRSRHWIKSKNPLSVAVRRESTEDWQRWPRRARSSSTR
jgi:hypothetical protein